MFRYKQLLIYNIIVAAIGILLCGLMLKNWKDVNRAVDNLSPNYKEIVIGHQRDIIDEKGYTTSDLIERISIELDSFRLQKCTDEGFAWIYLKDCSLGLDIVEGREFDKGDFTHNKNVALVSEDMRASVKDGYIDIENVVYEVVGIFEVDKNSVNMNSKCFLSMSSQGYMHSGNYIEGKYYLDYDGEKDIVRELDKWCYVRVGKSVYDMTITEKLGIIVSAFVIPFQFVEMVIFFVMISYIYMVYTWAMHMRKELGVRRICGATQMKIVGYMFKEYTLSLLKVLMVTGIVLGLVFASAASVLMTGMIMLIFGWLIISLCLVIFNHKGILQN